MSAKGLEPLTRHPLGAGLFKAKVSAKGLEPLTRHPLGAGFFKAKVSAKGLEPLTNGLKGHCSTIELRAQSE